MVPFRERISCTVLEAVAGTGIPKPKLYDAIADGRLECVKVDGRSLILIASLEKLVQSGSTESAEVGQAELCALERRGNLPTAQEPVFYRALGKSGFGLFLYLEEGLDLQTLDRLAKCTERAGIIRRLVSM